VFKQHSLPEKSVGIEILLFYKIEVQAEYFPQIFGPSFQYDQLYQVCTHLSWFVPVAFTPRPSNLEARKSKIVFS